MRPSVASLEAAGYATWSADTSIVIDGWTVRSNGGFTRRVNSATAVGTASVSEVTRDRIANWLEHRSASLAIRVTPLVDDATLEAVVDTWELVERDTTHVLVAPTLSSPSSEGLRLVSAHDEAFTRDLERLNDRADSSSSAWRRLLGRLDDAVGVWLPGEVVALAARHADIVMVYSVAVAPDRRRMGLATEAMRAASTWGSERGARWCALQVQGMNEGAVSLYDSLGYTEAYRYSYLQPDVPVPSR